jgi:hypothetical protein
MSVSYTAILPVRDQTVLYLSGLLQTEHGRRGTRAGRRARSTYRQAVLMLRWVLDGSRVRQLATDNAISASTTYDYLVKGFTVLAAQAPSLESSRSGAAFALSLLVNAVLSRRRRKADHGSSGSRQTSG